MVKTEWIKAIDESINNGVKPNIVKIAEEIGIYLGSGSQNEKLSTSQLRKFFGEVKRQQIAGYDAIAFAMLKPKLAYAVARNSKNAKIKDFYEIMTTAIDKVKNPETFARFITIFEAIVAYHKFAEEKNK